MEAGLLGKLGFDLEVAIANLVNFLVIFLLFRIFFFKPLQKTIDARRQKIEQGLQNAIVAEQALKDAQSQAHDVLLEAKKQAEVLLEDARTHAVKMREQAVLEGGTERTRLVAQASQQIDQERKRMEEDVERDMSRLVASLSEKVVSGENK